MLYLLRMHRFEKEAFHGLGALLETVIFLTGAPGSGSVGCGLGLVLRLGDSSPGRVGGGVGGWEGEGVGRALGSLPAARPRPLPVRATSGLLWGEGGV